MAPSDWVVSRICEEFNCPPSVALKEDASTVLSIMHLRQYARAYGVVMHPDSNEESVERAGVPKELVTQVMANAKRHLDGKRRR